MSNCVNILCMKWGDKYDASYVNKLYHMVKRHLSLPFRFICLTDQTSDIEPGIELFELPQVKGIRTAKRDGGWKKLLTFINPLYDITGPVLFLDLDIVIVNSIDDFFHVPGKFLIIRDWLRPDITGNSSVYRFEANQHPDILENFLANEETIRASHRNEQEYLTACMRNKGILTYWDDFLVKSFKRHCIQPGIKSWFVDPKLPEKARIVVFHGQPNPHEALVGKGGKWLRKVRRASWIQHHWQ